MPRKSLSERAAQRPEWMKIKVKNQETVDDVTDMMRRLRLTTVCEEAKCPNLFECWSDKTATFMLMGENCTRYCGFCAVGKRDLQPLDPLEPMKVAVAVERLGLDHAVLTSVNRDDLPDGGSHHFANAIRAVRERNPGCAVEVLIPDFAGRWDDLEVVLDAAPEVLNHNVETVPRLYKRVRNGSDFERSRELLRRAGAARPERIQRTKTGFMVGLGEERQELIETMELLREVDVDVLTIGQYLQPTNVQLPIDRYYHPDEFAELGEIAEKMGFLHVESGPFVRSSYHAKDHVDGAAKTKPQPDAGVA